MRRSTRLHATKRRPIIEDSCSDSESESPLKKQRKPLTPDFKENKQNYASNDQSSSESDIEKYLQKPHEIDLSSSFFKVQKKIEPLSNKTEENNTCRLSDTSDSEDDHLKQNDSNGLAATHIWNHPQASTSALTNSNELHFLQIDEFTRKLEEAKRHINQYNAKKNAEKKKSKIKKSEFESTDLDISSLLALGESKSLNLTDLRGDFHASDFDTSEDEWEEVKHKEENSEVKNVIPKEGLQITLGEMPEHCKKKKEVDLLAAIKRRLNRIRKENQTYVHKVHTLCWIAHGNYVNSVINCTEILAMALSLLPSDKCYPPDRIDLGYLEQIVSWYKNTIHIQEKPVPKKPDLKTTLYLQIHKKIAYNYKMYVYIFVAILRALGIQCRLALSFQVEPLRPPTSELHSLADLTKSKKGSEKPLNASTSKNKIPKNEPKNSSTSSSTAKANISKNTTNRTSTRSGHLEKEPVVSTKRERGAEVSSQEVKGLHRETTKKQKNKESKTFLKKEQKMLSDKSKNVSESREKQKAENTKNGKSKRESRSSLKNSLNPNKKVIEGESYSKLPNITLRVKPPSQKSKETELSQVDGLFDSDDEIPNSNNDLFQLDGSNDERTRSAKSKKPNLQRLKTVKKSNKGCIDKVETKAVKEAKFARPALEKLKSPLKDVSSKKSSTNLKFSNNNTNSEDEFVSSSRPRKSSISPQKHISNKSPIKQTLNVKNDIINLIKGRIVEQKYTDRCKMVKKRKQTYADEDSDSDYMPEPIRKKKPDSDSDSEYFVPKTRIKKRIVWRKEREELAEAGSPGSDEKKKKGINVWVEVFLEAEEKWIATDVVKGQVHCVNEIYTRATHPVAYVVVWNNNNTLKDVTMRYCKHFSTITRKIRVDPRWWEETLKPFMGKPTVRDREEDDDFHRQQLDQPLPKTIQEYKNHPLYALRRHLLKFEAIYPSDIVPIGYVNKEPVYPRNSVYVCHSRDIWLKEAKVVKPGEEPYKIVKGRPKYDKLSHKIVTGLMLELFGPWQTTDYEPPTAENGIVPRNAFGNVELFKPCMLPKQTVHLKLPGLNKVCRKMNIDCASAIVGFDFHGGWSHPTYDGFVICEEFADQVVAAWELEQEEQERKENEKIEKRVYGNWKKLIRGLLIRERLKIKYDFGNAASTSSKNKKKSTVQKKS